MTPASPTGICFKAKLEPTIRIIMSITNSHYIDLALNQAPITFLSCTNHPLAPERRGDLAQLGLRALLGGSLACFMTATIAGMLVK